MKKQVLFFIILFLVSYSFAQESSLKGSNEIYLGVADLDFSELSFQYKRGVGEKILISAKFINVSNNIRREEPHTGGNKYPEQNSALNLGIGIGLEWRKHVSEDMSLYIGPSLSYFHKRSSYRYETPVVPEELWDRKITMMMPGLGCAIGGIYKLKKGFSISAELSPTLYFSYISEKTPEIGGSIYDEIYESEFEFDSKQVQISLVYHWGNN